MRIDVALAPEVVRSRIESAFERERWSLMSPSGYGGRNDIFGHVDADGFRIQRRHLLSSAFNPQLYGRLRPVDGRTEIELHTGLHVIPRVQAALILVVAVAFVGIFTPA